jgi:N-glycosylase/DNA lyase
MLVDAHGSYKLPDEPIEAAEKWLRALRSKSAADAREELLKFVGVGRKVADCVMLMSLDKVNLFTLYPCADTTRREQKEVVPVDTHVYQIAVKHYGLKGTSNGRKVTMTPKIYEDVNTKLFSVWGDYAGWAHSVRFLSRFCSTYSHLYRSCLPLTSNRSPPTVLKPRQKVPLQPHRKMQTTLLSF